jgi:Resolvase, N terminal domain
MVRLVTAFSLLRTKAPRIVHPSAALWKRFSAVDRHMIVIVTGRFLSKVALKASGCELIFTEKVSGKSTNCRNEFKRLMRALKHGDTVVVTKPARVAAGGGDLVERGRTWRHGHVGRDGDEARI